VATTPKPLYHGQPGNTASTLYTAPTACVVRHIRAVNKDTTASYDLELWRNGSADVNAIIAKKTIPAGGEFEDDCYVPLASGDTIQGKASTAAKITVFVGGAEIV
jgi:hypothetical protein